ncbi:MAG: hypothetical protein NDI67_05815 [Sulfuritalea sp.]|nr:hypothetical protein [Sulfuritalea sp.]
MSKFTKVARAALSCAVMIAFAGPSSANAESVVVPVVPAIAPVPPPKPTPKPPPKLKPQPYVVQNDVTRAYQYRARILTGNPNCQRYAAESDAAFYNDKISDEAKVAQIEKIGAEAAARGCLEP